MRKVLIITLGAMCAAACYAQHPVEWYLAHPAEMKKRVDECVVSGDGGVDCRAAKNAYLRVHGMKDAY